jgi:hypothetical protein
VAAVLALIDEKLWRGEIHAKHSDSMVALIESEDQGDAGGPRAELFFVEIDGNAPVPRSGDVLVGFHSRLTDGPVSASLRVGPHVLGPVWVKGGGYAYALDGGAVLPLVALAFHEVKVAGRSGLVTVQAHLDKATRRSLAVYGGRHREPTGRQLLFGSGELHVAARGLEPHRVCKQSFNSESHFHDLSLSKP